MPGRERRGGQARVEVRDVRPRALDHGRDRQEGARFAEHHHGEEDRRPPAPGDGDEHHAGVGCAANQCGIVWSPSRLPFPLWVIMISLPMPVRAPTISTPERAPNVGYVSIKD